MYITLSIGSKNEYGAVWGNDPIHHLEHEIDSFEVEFEIIVFVSFEPIEDPYDFGVSGEIDAVSGYVFIPISLLVVLTATHLT